MTTRIPPLPEHHHHPHQLPKHPPQQQLPPIYPKRYFDASPTWFHWNPLTALDLHALREDPAFAGQNLYFHLNHPIHFVRLVGLLVDIQLTPGGKHVLLTLDDGSGVCVEVKTEVRSVKEGDDGVYPSTTLVDNLDVHVKMGLPEMCIDKRVVEVGTPLKVKGSIASFRGVRQVKLERIWVARDTNEEVKCWADTARWKREVLGRPWVLSQAEREGIDVRIESEARAGQERAKKRKAVSAEYVARKMRKSQKREERRRKEEAMLDKGALVGSHLLPDRVTDS